MAPNIAQLLSQARYRYQDQSKRDVSSVVSFYRNLTPKLDLYVYPDGNSKELLALEGTIPVSYRNNTYNIPVALYLPDNYPYAPPMCYVKPTADMQIKQSKHVDGSGRIYLPYLADWKHGTSDLLGVIQVMIVVFGETPPVYQKPKNQPFSSNASGATPYPAQGFPAMPQPATNTPYPTQAAPYPSYPSYPGYPTTSTGNQPGYPPASGYPGASPGYPRYPGQPAYPPVSSPTSGNANTNTVTAEHIRASLQSAVEDKLKAKEREVIEQKRAEINVLRNTAENLEKGKKRLEEIMSKMEEEAIELADSKSQLKEKDVQFKELLAKHEDGAKQDDIDEAFGPMEPLYKQLLNAFAEENAIQDTIYYLSEALQKNVIDLDLFLKNVRELSRKQFMLKALMQKCREKAGLPC